MMGRVNKIWVLWILLLLGCSSIPDFQEPSPNCQTQLTATHTIGQLKELFQSETFQIQEDWIISGYVISSDAAGNFFSEIYLQEHPDRISDALKINLDIRDNHLLYPVGSLVYIKVKGLYLGKSKEVFELGGTFAGFGSLSVGRLPALKVPEHVFVSCEPRLSLIPVPIQLGDLTESLTNHLVTLSNLEVIQEQRDSTYAQPLNQTKRTLVDCNGNEIGMINSGFSDFQDVPLPKGNGSITGVLLREREDYFIAIRDTSDVNFNNANCSKFLQTSSQVFFSELADPDNESQARFIELYNASDLSIDLGRWRIDRYTNDNTTVSSTIDLSGFKMSPHSTLVIASNANTFENTYGFVPDLEGGSNSPADSNGDDNLVLVDPFDKVIDAFGVIGQDGSGTNHEFEDGRAFRKLIVSNANAVFDFSEWDICNDTGSAGTLNEPKTAPQDFNPGNRN